MILVKVGTDIYNGQNVDIYMLQGTATGDAEVKQTKSGKAFAKVSVAAKKNPDSTTMFVSLVGFSGLCASVAGIKKGASVFAVGRLEKNEYNGKTYWNFTADYVDSAGGFVMGGFKPVAKASNTIVEITDTEEVLPF